MNYNIFNISEIYYLLKDKEFYLKLVDILKKRKLFDYTVFSYSIYHKDHASLRDFMNNKINRMKINKYLSYIDTSLLKISLDLNGSGG